MNIEHPYWKVPGLFKADPEEVYKELQTLEHVDADSIVELARNETSVLHNLIDWEDKVAAEKWRKHQGRMIMCNLVVDKIDKTTNEPIQIRVFSKLDGESGYEPTEQCLVIEESYNKLLEQAMRELRSFERKYKSIKQLAPVFEAIYEIAI